MVVKGQISPVYTHTYTCVCVYVHICTYGGVLKIEVPFGVAIIRFIVFLGLSWGSLSLSGGTKRRNSGLGSADHV